MKLQNNKSILICCKKNLKFATTLLNDRKIARGGG